MKPNHKIYGFSMMDLLLIIVAAGGIILVVLPQIAKRYARASKVSCTNNLKQVGLAFRMWAGDNNEKLPMQISVTNGGVMELAETGSVYAVFLVISNEINTPKILLCPNESNRKRVAASTFAASAPAGTILFSPTNNLSYFVGLDADDAKPEAIISGDDNFTIGTVQPKPGLFPLSSNDPVAWTPQRHVNAGNVGQADGSVQGFTTPGFRTALVKTGIATNRLVMP